MSNQSTFTSRLLKLSIISLGAYGLLNVARLIGMRVWAWDKLRSYPEIDAPRMAALNMGEVYPLGILLLMGAGIVLAALYFIGEWLFQSKATEEDEEDRKGFIVEFRDEDTPESLEVYLDTDPHPKYSLRSCQFTDDRWVIVWEAW